MVLCWFLFTGKISFHVTYTFSIGVVFESNQTEISKNEYHCGFSGNFCLLLCIRFPLKKPNEIGSTVDRKNLFIAPVGLGKYCDMFFYIFTL